MRTELRISGVGGQGIITLGYIFGRAAALYDKKRVIMTEAYGPEVTGGFSRADVVISDDEIDYPVINNPNILVVMDNEGWERDSSLLKEDGILIIDQDLVTPTGEVFHEITKIPAFQTAVELGRKVVANVVMMGALQEISQAVSKEALRKALLERVPKGTEELNLKALEEGYKLGQKLKKGGMN